MGHAGWKAMTRRADIVDRSLEGQGELFGAFEERIRSGVLVLAD